MKNGLRVVFSFAILAIIALALACEKEVVKEVEVIKEVEALPKDDASVLGVTPASFKWDGPTPTKFNESPMLAELVSQGTLPPVAERLPDEPLVLRVGETIGDFGGTWRNVSGCSSKGAGYRLLHDPVVILDVDDITPIEALAKSWDSSADYKTWTITLRKGLKWSDGAPMTADDFIWPVESVARNTDLFPNKRQGQLSNAGMGHYGMERGVGEVVKVSDTVFRYEFTKPAGNFAEEYAQRGWWGLSRVGAGFAVHLPSQYLKQFHADFADKAELDKMVSDAGFEEWTQLYLQKARLDQIGTPTMSAWLIVDDTPGAAKWERNPYYYAVDPEGNQLPYIDKLAYACGEDNEVINLKVLAGESDFHLGADFEKFPLFQQNASKGNYRSLEPPTALTVNITANQDFDSDKEIQRLLRSKDFRVAVSLSIDKQEVLDTFLFGRGKPANISFTPESPFYDDAEGLRNLYTVQDVDRANELLDGLGLTKRDSEGFRVRGDNGEKLEVELVTCSAISGGMQSDELIEAVAQYISDVGVRIRVFLSPCSEFVAYLRSNQQHLTGPHGFQGGRVPYTPDANWGPKMLEYANTGGASGTEPSDPNIKRMFAIFAEAMQLPYLDRRDLYLEAYKLLNENQYMIGLYTGTPAQNSYSIIKNNLRNIPSGWVSRYLNGGHAAARPEQFFFEGGKNDAGK